MGFVLNGDGVVCVDLDHCLSPDGVVAPWAAAVLAEAGSTWVEVSPSGNGLHVWGRGHLPQGRQVRVDGGIVECYGTGRYITVTGRTFGKAPRTLADLSGLLAAIAAV